MAVESSPAGGARWHHRSGSHLPGLWPAVQLRQRSPEEGIPAAPDSGRDHRSYGLTEPQAGSDSGATATRARKVGNDWVSQRHQGSSAQRLLRPGLHVHRGDGTMRRRARTAFRLLCRSDKTPGPVLGKKEDKMGLDPRTRPPSSSRMRWFPTATSSGTEGQGFKIFMQTLDGGRITIGSMGLGLGQGALDDAVQYAHEQERAVQDAVRRSVGAAKISTWRQNCRPAACLLYDAGHSARRPAASTRSPVRMAKYFASRAAVPPSEARHRADGERRHEGSHPHRTSFKDIKLCTSARGPRRCRNWSSPASCCETSIEKGVSGKISETRIRETF